MLFSMSELKPLEPAGRFAEAIAKGREKRASMTTAMPRFEPLTAPKLPEETSS
jgi:hypothetical protein